MNLVAGPADAGARLDVFLKGHFPEYSRGAIQKAIRDGFCLCDGKPLGDPAAKIKSGWNISFEIPGQERLIAGAAGEPVILWRDSSLAVCSKPAGLTVHPCPSCSEETLAHRLLAVFPDLPARDSLRPGIVHRLDKDTSGLILVALTEACRLKLAEAFAKREIRKTYLALAAGVAPEEGVCEKAIGRHPAIRTRMAVIPENHGGKPAFTEWRRLWHNDKISLLAVGIKTGRTHQIRAHLSHLGYPLLGDAVYAPRAIAALAPRQMLHAWQIAFRHPLTGENLQFLEPPPEDFFETILANSQKTQKIIVTGNQGCGKSSFCAELERLGLPVISADAVVAALYARGGEAAGWIAARFGSDAINPDGSVNKGALFKILEERPEMRRELEKVVHGLALAALERFWEANGKKSAAEIPLYFESGFQKTIGKDAFVIGVSCPKAERWRRIGANRGWSETKIETIESWQWPEERKMAACDLEIPNSGSKDDLIRAAGEFLTELEQREQARKHELDARIRKLCGEPFAPINKSCY